MNGKLSSFPCGRPKDSVKRAQNRETFHASEIWQKLKKYQLDKGLNQSQARRRIVETILESRGHFTGAELVKSVQKSFPKIGAATVYRNLPILVDAKVLRESLNDIEGQTVYEAEWLHHDHIICIDCDAIFEFISPEIEELQSGVALEMGFEEKHHKHVIYAKCQYKRSQSP